MSLISTLIGLRRIPEDVRPVSAVDPIPAVGLITNPTSSFTRTAGGDTTQYSIGDLVANSTTAASVVLPTITITRNAAGSSMLRRCKFHKTGTGITGAAFRIHLLGAAPATVTNGDNGAFSVSGVADYLGAFDVTIDRVFTDGACGFGVPVAGSEMSIKLASGTAIPWATEARGTYTPVSGEIFTLTLDDLQN